MPGGAICPKKLVSFFIKIKLISSLATQTTDRPIHRLYISRQESSQGQDQAAGRARRATVRAPHSPACRRRKPYTPAPLPPTASSTTSIDIISQEPTLLREHNPPKIHNTLKINHLQLTLVVGTPLKQGYLRQSLKDNGLSLNNLQRQPVVDQKKKRFINPSRKPYTNPSEPEGH